MTANPRDAEEPSRIAIWNHSFKACCSRSASPPRGLITAAQKPRLCPRSRDRLTRVLPRLFVFKRVHLGWFHVELRKSAQNKPTFLAGFYLMGPRGFEPRTSPLSGVRSDQLSYEPAARARENTLVSVGRRTRFCNRRPVGARSGYRGTSRSRSAGLRQWELGKKECGGQRCRGHLAFNLTSGLTFCSSPSCRSLLDNLSIQVRLKVRSEVRLKSMIRLP